MKTLVFLMVWSLLFIAFLPIAAQDASNGFAAVSGDGLATTTGGIGGEVVWVETVSDLKKYAGSSNSYIIMVKGTLEDDNWMDITVKSNKTIVGYGEDATLKNIELQLFDIQNVIIRNLTIRDSYVEGDWDGKTNDFDGIQVDNSHHIWIDHCFLTHCGDGLLDIRKASDYITISWVHFSNHNKAFGIGWTEETDWHMTIHHCWFDNTYQRNPSFDQGLGHLYNNYLSDIGGYGNLSRGNAQVVIQNSVFERDNYPLKISDSGLLFSSGNSFEDCTGTTAGNVTEMPFNPAIFYDYSLDETSQVKALVAEKSGPEKSIGDQYLTSSSGRMNTDNTNGWSYFYNSESKEIVLRVDQTQKVIFELFTYEGMKVLSRIITQKGESRILVNAIQSGVYIIRLESDDALMCNRIVVF